LLVSATDDKALELRNGLKKAVDLNETRSIRSTWTGLLQPLRILIKTLCLPLNNKTLLLASKKTVELKGPKFPRSSPYFPAIE
jgi:hypothetical protein